VKAYVIDSFGAAAQKEVEEEKEEEEASRFFCRKF